MGINILQTQKFKSEIEVINRIKWSLIYIDLEIYLGDWNIIYLLQ